MKDMIDSRSWTQGFSCYELLIVMVNINDFDSWAQGFRSYE